MSWTRTGLSLIVALSLVALPAAAKPKPQPPPGKAGAPPKGAPPARTKYPKPEPRCARKCAQRQAECNEGDTRHQTTERCSGHYQDCVKACPVDR